MPRRVMAWLLPLLAGTGLGVALPARVGAAPAEPAPMTTAGVEFPGPPPGKARATQHDGIITLENDVLAASWSAAGGILRPAGLSNKLTGVAYGQDGCETFRLATEAPAPKVAEGFAVTIRLAADKVFVLVSRDGIAWSELASYPRAEFPGAPKVVRIGKMNSLAEPKNHSTDGPVGAGSISELSPKPATIPTGRFDFKASAHEAATADYPFPAGSTTISCRIDKGTDQGMTWGPAIALIWEEGKRFLLVGVREKTPVLNLTTIAGERIVGANLGLYPGFDLPASAFRLTVPPRILRLDANPAGIRLAERLSGMAVEAEVIHERGLQVRWRAELRDGCGYLRQMIELTSPPRTSRLLGVEFADLRVPAPRTIGTAPGCPVLAGNLFFGVEMPGTRNALGATGARLGFSCELEVAPAQAYAFGAVCGVAPAGQLRRAFLHYIERERARPSTPFLHYNCWYDLGYGVDAPGLLDVVDVFHRELVAKRGVAVASYLADDGWDDPAQGLWVENRTKFPDGFKGLAATMAKSKARLGIWISPLGGYGGDQERTEQARRMGLIPANGRLDLAYPGYRQWFQERCLRLMREGGVNAFKWDRAGAGVSPHFMALLDVARNLRRENPGLFINVTVGTWPSPFWLNHVDCTWRDGSADVGWLGKGNDPNHEDCNRERWLTFRDGECRRLFVAASPLYPLNSCMHHGIVHGREFQGGSIGKVNPPDLKNEARSYFANGAMLQELYLTPSMMTPEAWDRVAEAAKWAHANADVLIDSHWVGGDPGKLEVYGYAAWNRRKGTLMLRNPDARPQSVTLDAAAVFELPAGTPAEYRLTSPYRDQRVQAVTLIAGQPRALSLEPFEVLVFDAFGKGTQAP